MALVGGYVDCYSFPLSSLMSNSLAIDSAFSNSGVVVRMVGRPISAGITASILYVSANGEMLVGFRAVVL